MYRAGTLGLETPEGDIVCELEMYEGPQCSCKLYMPYLWRSKKEADAYFETYGNLAWDDGPNWDGFDDEAKKQALVLGTQAVDLLYGAKYMSYIALESQPLLFPREQFYDNDGRTVNGIPACLKNVVAELALKTLSGEDVFPIESTSNNTKISGITVGGIAINRQTFKADAGETFDGFRKIDILIRPIVKQKNPSWRIKA
jgi:hypothetical protein